MASEGKCSDKHSTGRSGKASGKSKSNKSRSDSSLEVSSLSWYTCVYNFNWIFIVSGCVTLCLGVWLWMVAGRITGLTHHLDTSPPILIIYGLAVIFIASSSFFFLTQPILLFLYCGLIVVLFLWGILMGAYIFLSECNMEDAIAEDISYHMTNYGHEDYPVMDKIQSELECCGNNEPFDWFKTPLGQVPQSCCKSPDCEPTKLEDIFTDGCVDRVRKYVHCNTDFIGIVIFATALVPMVGAVFVFCLGYETFCACSG